MGKALPKLFESDFKVPARQAVTPEDVDSLDTESDSLHASHLLRIAGVPSSYILLVSYEISIHEGIRQRKLTLLSLL